MSMSLIAALAGHKIWDANMQGPIGFTEVVTIPPGAQPGQQRIVIDGTRGAIFEYNTPGNTLVSSWAASAGTDPYGNTYPQGISIGPGSIIEGTDFVIDSTGAFWYSGTPGPGNLILSLASAAGTDGYGNIYPEGLGVTTGSISGGAITAGSIPATAVDFTATSIGGITTYVGGTAPTGSINAGSLWIDTSAGNALYQYESGTWTLYQFGTGSIAADSITAAQIAANTITVSQLAAGIVYAGIVNGTVIESAEYLGTGTGKEFVLYSGTPAANNLFASIVSATYVDAYGNAVMGGATVYYKVGSTYYAVQTADDSVNYYTSTTGQSGWVLQGSVGINGANNQMVLYGNNGIELEGNVIPVVLASQSSAPGATAGNPTVYGDSVGHLEYVDGVSGSETTWKTGHILGVLTANQILTTSLLAIGNAPPNGMYDIPLGVGTYRIYAVINYIATTTGGYISAEMYTSDTLVIASTSSVNWRDDQNAAAGSAGTIGARQTITALSSVVRGLATTTTSYNRQAILDGTIKVTTAGHLTINASYTTDGITVLAGSYILIEPV